ncbi:MAG: CBS domain-containing protein [Methanosarcinales archaeon Met12]|nr:MAG: CBS domain-containing protein [Methanosarcinales archaeon Met12]
MIVSEIMHKPTFVDSMSTVTDTAKIMCEKNIASVIVGSATDSKGILTERDVIKKVVAGGIDPKTTLVKNVMHPAVVTINENASVQDAVKLLMTHYIRHLPVSDDSGKVVGMVSARTVMDALGRLYVSERRRRSSRPPSF